MVALPAVVIIGGCCGFPLYWLHHERMNEHPERIYPYYKRELHEYGRRLEAGDVRYVEDRGYGIPRFLIDKGAKWVVKNEDCYVVVFHTFVDNPTPELWYSPAGFDPMPPTAAKLAADPKARWQPLAPQWAACYRP
jgi:hypothetical protein